VDRGDERSGRSCREQLAAEQLDVRIDRPLGEGVTVAPDARDDLGARAVAADPTDALPTEPEAYVP